MMIIIIIILIMIEYIILDKITNANNAVLRQNQVDFRNGRSCCKQIFALRQIIENITIHNS